MFLFQHGHQSCKTEFSCKSIFDDPVAAYAHPIEEKVIREYQADQNRQHDQKISRTNALAMTMDPLVPTFVRRKYKEALDAFDKIVQDTREIVRPGRSNPRNKNKRNLTL